MITYLWITGILALVLVTLSMAVLGRVIGAAGLIIAAIHGVGWLVKLW